MAFVTKPCVDRVWFSVLMHRMHSDFTLYLTDCLFHLGLGEGRYGGLKVVYNALKTVTLQYLSLVAAQQTQGHLKNHLGALDKKQVCRTKCTYIQKMRRQKQGRELSRLISPQLCLVVNSTVHAAAPTKDAGDEAEGKLRGEEREEPRRSIQAGADLVLLQVRIQAAVVVVQQSGQLVHLNLHRHKSRRVRRMNSDRADRLRAGCGCWIFF